MRYSFRMATTQMLLNALRFNLSPSRTADQTGLTGKNDFKLEFSQPGIPGVGGRPFVPSPDAVVDPAPDLFNALEKQLGLKLEKGKTPLDVIVIDHLDKQPGEN